MEYDKEEGEIILNRIPSKLDKLALKFTKNLKEYVIVSGYVAILLGRSRATEDIDLLVPKLSKEQFSELWKKLEKDGFQCINTSKIDEAYDVLNEHAIRFYQEEPVPNIEFKIIKNALDEYSFKNKIKVNLNKDVLYISPIEMQIVFKLFLAADETEEEIVADKDIEDARHLYKLFEGKLNKEELIILANKIGVKKRLELLK